MACNITCTEKSGYKSTYRNVNSFVKTLTRYTEKIKIFEKG